MDRNTLIVAYSIPAFIFLWDIWLLIRGPQGSGFTATGVPTTVGISLLGVVLVVIITSIALYILRERQLRWWHGLLLCIGAYVVLTLLFILFAHFTSAPVTPMAKV